jgi:hypothetical protein
MKINILEIIQKYFGKRDVKFRIDSDDDNAPSVQGHIELHDLKCYCALDLKEIYDEIKKAAKR